MTIMIKTRTFSFLSGYDNVPIYGVCMIPERPVGIFQMVHGMCEHKERFFPFMQNMAQRGYITLMHDSRGHGESVKYKDDIGYCYASREKGYIEDIYQITKQIKKEYPGLPLILYGHSLGSLAVRTYLRKYDDEIAALIVSGCPTYNKLVPLGKALLQIVKWCFGDRCRISFAQNLVNGSYCGRFAAEKRNYAWVAAKKSVAEEFEKDALCMFTYTLNGYETLLNLEYMTYRAPAYKVKNPELPILFLSGQEDPCYGNERKWEQAIRRMKDLGYDNVTGKKYAGMRHEIHNEERNDIVFDEIDSFCRKAIKG